MSDSVKLLNLKLKSCFGCPYHRTPSDDLIKIDWCYRKAMIILNINTEQFPDWCDLDNVPFT